MNLNFERMFKRFLEWSGISFVFSLLVIVVLAVVLRKLGYSLQWYDEVSSILLAWVTYIGGALVALNRAHLGFSDLVTLLPKRLRLTVFIISEIVVLGFFATLVYGYFQLVPIMQGMNLASIPEIPVWSVQLALPIGSVLFITAQILSVRRAWDQVSRKNKELIV